jgi:type IV secretory pathway TrbD component
MISQVQGEMNKNNKESIQRLEADYDFTSGQISELARYIGFGLAGLTVLLALSDSTFAQSMMAEFKREILILSGIGCAIILLDYMQYVVGFYATAKALSRVKSAKDQVHDDSFRRSRKFRDGFFVTKQWLAVGGAIGLIYLLMSAAFSDRITISREDCPKSGVSIVAQFEGTPVNGCAQVR